MYDRRHIMSKSITTNMDNLGDIELTVTEIQDQGLKIRTIQVEDLPKLWKLQYGEESPEWRKWDAPYYAFNRLTYDEYMDKQARYIDQDDYWLIEHEGEILGTVSYYWEHEPSLWLEMGIIIYNPNYWSGGFGTRVLKMWIEHLFTVMPLVRVGFTTWSGNHRMMKVGEKLGMTLEARLRKCRYYEGVYYDSIRMGMLREEWEAVKDKL